MVQKELEWVGSSKDDLDALPKQVRHDIGYALHLAQCGDKSVLACPLAGFGGAAVPEIITNHDGDTYRTVYTVRFKKAVYVLHVFKKKSKRGIKTPQKDIELIRERLKQAQAHYRQHYEN